MADISFHNEIIQPLIHSLTCYADRNAFFIKGVFYTYRQLANAVEGIRRAIRSLRPDNGMVALLAGDDLETYASIIALWFEGLAYVPLHPLQPVERNLNITGQTETKLLLHSVQNHQLIKNIDTKEVKTLCTATLAASHTDMADAVATPDDSLAYILFTSGSTGTPKGVCISRRNLAAFFNSFWRTGFAIDCSDRCLQAFDLTFDVSIQAFLSALLRGACVYTIPYGQVKYIYAASLLMEHQITSAAMAPSMLTYLSPYFDQMRVESLRTTILTAEACPTDLIDKWFACAPNTEIYDFYGPTEGTIYCTAYHLKRGQPPLEAHGTTAIGLPLANVKATLIDEDGTPLPQSAKGELCISGPQVTQGYWHNPERNEKAFINVEVDGMCDRYYRTGDLCQQLPDGNLLYFGRIDQQAKIQGYRVELGEIEFHARAFYGGAHRTVAMAYQNASGLTEIALFVEAPTDDPSPLKQYLASKLPSYMIPSQVIFRQQFPTNRSEKVDRMALKQSL